VNAGGIAAIVDYIGETKGSVRLPGIMMLGYVAAHSENLAMAVVVSKVFCCTVLDTMQYLHTQIGSMQLDNKHQLQAQFITRCAV
jgi:hypothetical protein